jgi:ubiquinone/menaquinone biosynthesis C-methylase UbiE
VESASRDIAEKYDRFARGYDRVEAVLGFLGVEKLRKGVVSTASGKVLEVAVGTGKNLYHYRSDCEIVGADISTEMLKVARERAAKLQRDVHFTLADAGDLPFRTHLFDTVVSTFSTCTFPNPSKALQEMIRVTKPSGKVLLLEHGRSDRGWLGRWQDRHEDLFAKHFACHWNREPLKLAEHADLRIVRAQRTFFGMLHRIEAEPQI